MNAIPSLNAVGFGRGSGGRKEPGKFILMSMLKFKKKKKNHLKYSTMSILIN